MTIRLLKTTLLCVLLLGILPIMNAQSTSKFSVLFGNHFSKSYYDNSGYSAKTPKDGTYSWGVEAHYHFRRSNKKSHLSLGLMLQRLGHGEQELRESVPPEYKEDFEERYGKLPVKIIRREFVYYLSLPLTVHFKLPKSWFISPYIALEYPLAIGNFTKYESAGGVKITKDRTSFNTIAFYPELCSLGTGFQIGKEISLNGKPTFSVAAKFSSHSLLSISRSHDDFRLKREEYPFSVGVNVGFLF